jgi:hypothetical protein
MQIMDFIAPWFSEILFETFPRFSEKALFLYTIILRLTATLKRSISMTTLFQSLHEYAPSGAHTHALRDENMIQPLKDIIG